MYSSLQGRYFDLVQENGQKDRHQLAGYHLQERNEKGIPNDPSGPSGIEQAYKVFKPNKFTAQKALGGNKVLKGHD